MRFFTDPSGAVLRAWPGSGTRGRSGGTARGGGSRTRCG